MWKVSLKLQIILKQKWHNQQQTSVLKKNKISLNTNDIFKQQIIMTATFRTCSQKSNDFKSAIKIFWGFREKFSNIFLKSRIYTVSFSSTLYKFCTKVLIHKHPSLCMFYLHHVPLLRNYPIQKGNILTLYILEILNCYFSSKSFFFHSVFTQF